MKKELVLTDFMDPRPKEGGLWYRIRRAARIIGHRLLPRNMPRGFCRAGVRYFLSRRDAAGLMLKGEWEREQVVYFFNEVRRRECDVFFDIGAHFGLYSLLAAKVGDFAEMHAFEPHPETYRKLQAHIRINSFAAGIKTHNVAASDKTGEMFIWTPNNPSNCRVSADKPEGKAAVAIKAAALDSMLDFNGRNIAIKMDVEGHEVAALQGMPRLLSRNKIFLQVEIWGSQMDSFHWLQANGFHCVHRVADDFYFVNE